MEGGIHKLRLQQERGRRSKKKLTFGHRLYQKKMSMKGVGGQKKSKSCQRGLWTPPNDDTSLFDQLYG